MNIILKKMIIFCSVLNLTFCTFAKRSFCTHQKNKECVLKCNISGKNNFELVYILAAVHLILSIMCDFLA
jgi:hypothetical protein